MFRSGTTAGAAALRWQACSRRSFRRAVLDHMQSLSEGQFKTKDLRTLLAAREAEELVDKTPPPQTVREYRRLGGRDSTAKRGVTS